MNRLVKQFLQDRGGNFGMMTAILALPLVLAGGSIIDYSLASLERTRMQGISDSAALAGAKVYDGTNAADAKAAAKAFLDGYAGDLAEGTTYQIGMNGQTVQVSLDSASANAFMGIVGMTSTPIGVVSAAVAPLKPRTVTFTPTKAQGYWYKKVSIIVQRPGSANETVIGTVVYQPETHNDAGQGHMTIAPSSTFDLGRYSRLVLQMEVKKDGCPIGSSATYGSDNSVKCHVVPTNDPKYSGVRKYDSVMRTDDPKTSHHLFVDKVQLPKGAPSPLDSLFECGKTAEHAWEDGGGFERQDFFYTVTSICAPDGDYVRLTK
jgi:Flp pilus assembly protein TadG